MTCETLGNCFLFSIYNFIYELVSDVRILIKRCVIIDVPVTLRESKITLLCIYNVNKSA